MKKNVAVYSEENLTDAENNNLEQLKKELFKALDYEHVGAITKKNLLKAIFDCGISRRDVRVMITMDELSQLEDGDKIDFRLFKEIIEYNFPIIKKCIRNEFIIPSFQKFSEEIQEIYRKVRFNDDGQVATYIPQLSRIDPGKFGVAVCTIDGQRLGIGDADECFCVQSITKPMNYCMALEEHGTEIVHKYIGREPSGAVFNELSLNKDRLPHNPMINSGAIMCCSLIKSQLNSADKFDYVMSYWEKACGSQRPGFDMSVYLSERETADRNFALGYFMKENHIFPKGSDLQEILDFYFECCSIDITCNQLACVAATFANAGVCPLTGIQVFEPETVKNCLSLMSSCGLYDFSGEFAFTVGLPAKSGVSGGILVVVPNVLGIAIWSPPVDKNGNSVRGVEFCKELVNKFNFHNYESLIRRTNKIDPRLP